MTEHATAARELRPRRSNLAVAGSSVKMIEKAKGLDADQVFLDLEDACAPLANAWPQKRWHVALAEPVPTAPTRAGAIADSLRGYEREGLLTLAAVRASGGTVGAVDEDSILAATRQLSRRGLLVEPAAAAALAALEVDRVRDTLTNAADVVLILTGHGAKEPLLTPQAEQPVESRS